MAWLIANGRDRPADDHMIQHPDVDNPASIDELPGDAQVFTAWGRVARRVVVNDNHPRCAVLDRRPENLTWMRGRGIGQPQGNQMPVDKPVLGVEAQDVE